MHLLLDLKKRIRHQTNIYLFRIKHNTNSNTPACRFRLCPIFPLLSHQFYSSLCVCVQLQFGGYLGHGHFTVNKKGIEKSGSYWFLTLFIQVSNGTIECFVYMHVYHEWWYGASHHKTAMQVYTKNVLFGGLQEKGVCPHPIPK